MGEPIRIAVILSGGMVQQVLTAGVPVECVVVDYDTEGAALDELSQTEEGPALLSIWSADPTAPAEVLAFHAAAHDVESSGCASGLHSWVDAVGRLDPETTCTHCGETYGHPD